MKRSKLFAALLGIAATAAATLLAASPANAGTTDLHLQNYGTLMCLQPQNGSFADGAPIVQTFCNGSAVQGWNFISLGSSKYRVQNAATGLCLYVDGNTNTNRVPVVQGFCANVSNETWKIATLTDFTQLRSQVASTNTHCLDVPGGQAIDGAAMQIYVCNGTGAQAWAIAIGIIIQS
jgi:hypothetical protein